MPERRFFPPDARVIGVVGIAHGGSHFFHLVLPPLFPMIRADLDLTYTELGLVMTLFFAVSGIAQTMAGIVVDRIGAARVLASGLAAFTLGALLASTAQDYPTLLLAAALLGLGNSVFHPADYAILSEHVEQNRLGRAFAIHTTGGSIGWAIAPVLMTAIASASSWRTALVVAAMIAAVLAATVFVERHRLETTTSAARKRAAGGADATADAGTGMLAILLMPAVMWCFLFFCFQAAAIIALQNFMPLALSELQDLPILVTSWSITAFMVGSALGTLLGGVMADRFGHHQAIIASGLLAGAILILFVGVAGLPIALMMPVIALAGALTGMTTPSRDLLVRSATPAGSTGKVFGFVYSGLDLGATFSPAIAGWMIDQGMPVLLFYFVAAMTILSLAAAAAVRPPAAGVQRA